MHLSFAHHVVQYYYHPVPASTIDEPRKLSGLFIVGARCWLSLVEFLDGAALPHHGGVGGAIRSCLLFRREDLSAVVPLFAVAERHGRACTETEDEPGRTTTEKTMSKARKLRATQSL